MLELFLYIREHVYTPGAISASARGLVHKSATVISQFAFDTPNHAPLNSYCASVAAITSDMGDEMGIKQFHVGQAIT